MSNSNVNMNTTKRSITTSQGKTHRNTMYTSYIDDFEKQKKDEIKEVFDLFDTEQKGMILGSNMKICLKTLGIDIKKKELAPILKDMFNKGIDDWYKFDQFYQVTKKKMDEKDPDEEMAKEFYLLCDYKEDNKEEEREKSYNAGFEQGFTDGQDWANVENSVTLLLALHRAYDFEPDQLMNVVEKSTKYVHQANEGKPTIGTLARQLYNECQIKLCEHEVEILRKYSLFEEGDPYD